MLSLPTGASFTSNVPLARIIFGKLRRDVEQAVNANRMEDQQAGRLLRFYEDALQGYTYLEDPNAD